MTWRIYAVSILYLVIGFGHGIFFERIRLERKAEEELIAKHKSKTIEFEMC